LRKGKKEGKKKIYMILFPLLSQGEPYQNSKREDGFLLAQE